MIQAEDQYLPRSSAEPSKTLSLSDMQPTLLSLLFFLSVNTKYAKIMNVQNKYVGSLLQDDVGELHVSCI